MNLYDPKAETLCSEHCLPHWMQDGTITFVTLRQADSLPRETLRRWDEERMEFLRLHGVQSTDWKSGRAQLTPDLQRSFDNCFYRKKEMELDRCHGNCQLQDRRAARIVHDALLYFDDKRYFMGDFVIMPNHVHLLVVFPDATQLRTQCYSWMHFTATKVNQLFGNSGSFWQEEAFDHLVRSEQQLKYLREYIAQNPNNAKLQNGEFLYRRSNRAF